MHYTTSTRTAYSRRHATFDVVPETLMQAHDGHLPAIRREPQEIHA